MATETRFPGVTLRSYYPEIEPYASGHLDVGNGHQVYWERIGTSGAKPAVFLHGGPGGGLSANQRRVFDPARYDVLLFDQRGCGKSRPFAELEHNTTWDLVADIERLRQMVGVEQWLVFGGSWGSTLALAYAQAHPEAVKSLTLRGIFLFRQHEVDWYFRGLRRFLPEAWRAFAGHLPPQDRDDVLAGYAKLVMDPDPAVHMPAAHAWGAYEGGGATLLPSPETVAGLTDDVTALGLARMNVHYMSARGFFPEGALLDNIDRIRHIPGTIVQGRYDLICPIASADDLARAWPEARYVIIPDAGHSAFEPGTQAALVAATDRYRSL